MLGVKQATSIDNFNSTFMVDYSIVIKSWKTGQMNSLFRMFPHLQKFKNSSNFSVGFRTPDGQETSFGRLFDRPTNFSLTIK